MRDVRDDGTKQQQFHSIPKHTTACFRWFWRNYWNLLSHTHTNTPASHPLCSIYPRRFTFFFGNDRTERQCATHKAVVQCVKSDTFADTNKFLITTERRGFGTWSRKLRVGRQHEMVRTSSSSFYDSDEKTFQWNSSLFQHQCSLSFHLTVIFISLCSQMRIV